MRINNNNNNNSITYFVFWKCEHELFPGLNTGSSNYNKSFVITCLTAALSKLFIVLLSNYSLPGGSLTKNNADKTHIKV